MNYKVLVVEDDASVRKMIQNRLQSEGFDIQLASNFDEAYNIFGTGQGFSCVVTDIRMTGKDGFALMDYFKKKSPQTRFILITGHGNKEAAIQALKMGASDYIEKPIDMDDLYQSVRRSHREYTLEIENKDLLGRLEARLERVEGKKVENKTFVSSSQSMAKVQEWLNVLKRESLRTEAEEPTVLVYGETGTGKEMVSRQVHENSRRATGPWVAVNCANFSEQLLESELFGHERGAFTGAQTMKRGLFEIAKGGTLFLDEVAEMDLKSQAKLLRVLQEKTFRRVGGTSDLKADIRLVAATHTHLKTLVETGRFREDLYHRLNKIVVEIPSLKDRKEDLIPMAIHFAQNAFKKRAKEFPGFSSEVEDALRSYKWPGNVREMENMMERAALIYKVGAGFLSSAELGLPSSVAFTDTAKVIPIRPTLTVVKNTVGEATGVSNSAPVDSGYMEMKKQWVDAFEKDYLHTILKRHHGNVSAAARDARLDRSNFLRLLRRHTIKALDYRLGVFDKETEKKAA